MDYVGADRFLWATDYPHTDHGADYVHELDELLGRLSPAAAAAIAGQNAARLYRL
jgi:predicted TIM-barrel fold metal-dependent hydrolase